MENGRVLFVFRLSELKTLIHDPDRCSAAPGCRSRSLSRRLPLFFTPGDPKKLTMNIPSASEASALALQFAVPCVRSLRKPPYFCVRMKSEHQVSPREATEGQERWK